MEWIASSGQQAPDNGRVVFVKDWDEAIAAFQAETFDTATLQAKNLMLRLYHQNHASNWNDLMEVLKPIVMPMVKEKIGSAKEKAFVQASYQIRFTWFCCLLHFIFNAGIHCQK